jgi:tRNA 2-thiouridine synthesizing protein A
MDLAAWRHLTGHTYRGPVDQPPSTPTYALRTMARGLRSHPHSPWGLSQ